MSGLRPENRGTGKVVGVLQPKVTGHTAEWLKVTRAIRKVVCSPDAEDQEQTHSKSLKAMHPMEKCSTLRFGSSEPNDRIRTPP